MFRATAISKRTIHAPPLCRLPPTSYSRLSSALRHPLPARPYATVPEPPASSKLLRRCRTTAKYTLLLLGSSVVGCVVLTGAIFLHDAFTYNERVSTVPSLDMRSFLFMLLSTLTACLLHRARCNPSAAARRTYPSCLLCSATGRMTRTAVLRRNLIW